MNEIKPIRIPAEVMASYCKIMAAGNAKLKQCARLAGMKNKDFRGKLFRTGMQPENMGVTPKVVMAVNQALPDIKAVRKLEGPLFNSVVQIAWKLAKQVSGWGAVEYPDAEQEAYAALVDAIYGYTRPNIKFGSLAWNAVRRRLMAVHNRQNALSPPSREVVHLIAAYEQQKERMSTQGPASQEQVIDSMWISDEDREALLDHFSATKVVHGLSMIEPNEGDAFQDYTSFRRGIDNERDAIQDCEVRDAMEHAGLTDFETKVMLASLHPHRGWMTELAAATINPRTNKPFSKRAIGLFLERALTKVRNVYEFAERRMVG